MSAVAIRAEGLSKRYRIGQALRYKALRDTLSDVIAAPFRWIPAAMNGTAVHNGRTRNLIWALKDVSFQIHPGEVVGIIGRNGSGKSTLLKILSRITEPTRGYAEIRGRVGSLLEVGTGFHPELTGRENVYLNGAILGMKRREIDRKFDEIVAFAEIDRFLDTPVKFYSTGMQVRLGFSVAAHLEPEILFVDEVLAVGDAAFQRKCLGKMGEVTREGRTVLFVSHNMPTIQALCSRVLWIQSGELIQSGAPDVVINRYLNVGLGDTGSDVELGHHSRRSRSEEPALRRAWIERRDGSRGANIRMGDGLVVAMAFQCSRPIVNAGFGFGIEDEHGRRVFSLNNYMTGPDGRFPKTATAGVARLHVDAVPLLPGRYFVSLSLTENQGTWIDFVERALSFDVEPADVYGSGKIPERTQGVVYVPGRISVATNGEAQLVR